ncbi:hypothetical protein ACWD11_34150 [Streptomyces sp. NPDC002776]
MADVVCRRPAPTDTTPDPSPPGFAPASRTARQDFPYDELDPGHHRRGILALAEHLGADLRHTHDATGTLTLDVR